MEQDLDVFRMVQTMYKLKASIKVLASKMNDKSIYLEIQDSFLKEMIIHSESEDENNQPDNELQDFLNRDEKRALVASKNDHE
jgi:hypothetical protein